MKFYTLKQIFNLITLLCSSGGKWALLVCWAWTHAPARGKKYEAVGGKYALPKYIFDVYTSPSGCSQPRIINHARVPQNGKQEKYIFFCASRLAACLANCQKSFFKRAGLRYDFFPFIFKNTLHPVFVAASTWLRLLLSLRLVPGFSLARKFA